MGLEIPTSARNAPADADVVARMDAGPRLGDPRARSRRRRMAFAGGVAAIAAFAALGRREAAAGANGCPHASVLVRKSAGELELMCDGEVRARFAATFGHSPIGPKEREGDGRTPEGSYTIVSRVKTPRFDRFIGLSYPNANDRKRAREKGITRLGGGIGIHGTSEKLAPLARAFTRVAHATGLAGVWGATDGCVGLVNDDVEALYDAVGIGTPVTIEP